MCAATTQHLHEWDVDDDEMMNIHYHSLCATTTSSDGDDYQLRVSFLLVGTLGGV